MEKKIIYNIHKKKVFNELSSYCNQDLHALAQYCILYSFQQYSNQLVLTMVLLHL